MSKTCTNCGMQNDEEYKFCTQCGAMFPPVQAVTNSFSDESKTVYNTGIKIEKACSITSRVVSALGMVYSIAIMYFCKDDYESAFAVGIIFVLPMIILIGTLIWNMLILEKRCKDN